MSDMRGSIFSATLSIFFTFLRRWAASLGHLQAPSRSPDCAAYAALAQLRKQRTARRYFPNVIPFPSCLDDAQIKLRITM
jgi:hypothetical protein